MIDGRGSIGQVVEVDGLSALVILQDAAKSQIVTHHDGLSSFEQPEDLVGVGSSGIILVGRIEKLFFAEPKDLLGASSKHGPLRQMRLKIIGALVRKVGTALSFQANSTQLPALGSAVFPLSFTERQAILGTPEIRSEPLCLGYDSRHPSIPIDVDIDEFLGRHVAVMGGTGQGKTNFIAQILQRVTAKPNARAVIFDINGEYGSAFENSEARVQYTVVGREMTRLAPHGATLMRIPYYALGRPGLFRLLLPSERTQSPALRFALQHLSYTEADPFCAWPAGQRKVGTLHDDCVSGDPESAAAALELIEDANERQEADNWPNMRAIACLASEKYVLKQGRNRIERDAFLYGHIQTMLKRIDTLLSDDAVGEILDTAGGPPSGDALNLEDEARAFCEQMFGTAEQAAEDWNVHIVDLSRVANDLLPFVVGATLETFASLLFRRGPEGTHPTLLVLEEAHHYLRQVQGDAETGQNALAYERLAKEGRKFGTSLLVSTQRPAEVSPTVLAQCGSWAIFRLTNESDQKAVASATEFTSSRVSALLSTLARGEALLFGASRPIAVKLRFDKPIPGPTSSDPRFTERWAAKP
jgi:uncharacterized protein DUF87